MKHSGELWLDLEAKRCIFCQDKMRELVALVIFLSKWQKASKVRRYKISLYKDVVLWSKNSCRLGWLWVNVCSKFSFGVCFYPLIFNHHRPPPVLQCNICWKVTRLSCLALTKRMSVCSAAQRAIETVWCQSAYIALMCLLCLISTGLKCKRRSGGNYPHLHTWFKKKSAWCFNVFVSLF